MSGMMSRYRNWLRPPSRKSILWCSLFFLFAPSLLDWLQGWEMTFPVQVWWAVMDVLGVFFAGVTGRWTVQWYLARNEERRVSNTDRQHREHGAMTPSRLSILGFALVFCVVASSIIRLGGLELALHRQIGWTATSFLAASSCAGFADDSPSATIPLRHKR